MTGDDQTSGDAGEELAEAARAPMKKLSCRRIILPSMRVVERGRRQAFGALELSGNSLFGAAFKDEGASRRADGSTTASSRPEPRVLGKGRPASVTRIQGEFCMIHPPGGVVVPEKLTWLVCRNKVRTFKSDHGPSYVAAGPRSERRLGAELTAGRQRLLPDGGCTASLDVFTETEPSFRSSS